MQSYKDLIVWQKSVELVKMTYRLSATFPKSEMFGLTSQMRRAAVSIPANLAEGYSRKHRGEYIQFTRIAYGSGAELETYSLLIKDLGYVNDLQLKEFQALLTEVLRMLNKLTSALEE
jgi:four helix bundle protein